MDDILDAVVIGAGPAGLTAAIYLARFRRRFLLIHDGRSRADWIPRTRNHPGFPEGVVGSELLARMTAQAQRFAAPMREGWVSELAPEAEGFRLTVDRAPLRARTVLLATGVVDTLPDIEGAEAAVVGGLMRICPICDAYEIIDKPVAVLGEDALAAREALFLADYTHDVTVLHTGAPAAMPHDERARLAAGGVRLVETEVGRVSLDVAGGVAACATAEGERRFAAIYVALGVTPRSNLADQAGARLGDDDRLLVDAHQQTTVPGLYAAGDMVRGLNQISTAEGEAATAATAIHNRLRERDARPAVQPP